MGPEKRWLELEPAEWYKDIRVTAQVEGVQGSGFGVREREREREREAYRRLEDLVVYPIAAGSNHAHTGGWRKPWR